jgi:predicted adenylyl cyclase CyaB
LIAYERPDVEGPKRSDYILTPVSDPTTMTDALNKSVGQLGKVTKRREASIVEWKGLSARIHLDEVENLGDFIEFEVIINKDSEVALGEDMVLYLSNTFGIKDEHLIKEAYFDLIYKK